MSKRKRTVQLQPTRKGSESKESAGLQAAQAAREGRRGKPSEHDAPPLSTFPGSTPKPIPGQQRLDGLDVSRMSEVRAFLPANKRPRAVTLGRFLLR